MESFDLVANQNDMSVVSVRTYKNSYKIWFVHHLHIHIGNIIYLRDCCVNRTTTEDDKTNSRAKKKSVAEKKIKVSKK